MNIFLIGLLYHFAAIQRLLPRYGVEARIDMADGVLVVHGRSRSYRLYPQYIHDRGGRPCFSTEIGDRGRAFAGWRPYFNKRWPIAIDKLAFKEFCRQRGLRTPAMWRQPSPEMRDYLVKHANSSFGMDMNGPFRTCDPGNPASHVSKEGGYYEAFVAGQIVKALYWNDRLVALDVKAPPRVTGDGKRSVRELVAAIVRPAAPQDEWQVYAEVAAYQGFSLDSVPARDQVVWVDFRYGTYAEPVTLDNLNQLRRSPDSPLIRHLQELGPALWQGIPEDLRDCSLYSVDAMLDAQDRVWLLEMNCNPGCHPDCYDAMFATLFGAPEAAAPAPVPPQSALPPYCAVPRPSAAASTPAAAPSPVPAAVMRTRWLC